MQISADTAQLRTAVMDVNKRLDEMGDSGKKAADDLSVLKNIEIAKVFVNGIKMVADGLMSAARSAKGLFDDSRQAIDAIGKLASQTGVTVEAIQSYQLAAELSGVSTEELAKALQRLNVRLGDVEEGSKSDPFAKLGLSIKELKQLRPEETFERVADAVSSLATDADKAAAANEIFGRNGVVLLPLFHQGADGLRAMREEAEQLQLVLSEEEVRNVEAMNDAFSKVGAAIQGIINQVTAEMAPRLLGAAEGFLDIIKQVDLDAVAKTIADSLFAVVDAILAGLQFVVGTLITAADELRKAISLIPGVDLSTDAEREQRSLQERSDAERRASSTSGRNARGAQLALERAGGRLSDQERQRLADLSAKEAAGGIKAAANSFFNEARAAVAGARERVVPDALPETQMARQATSVENSNKEMVDAVKENTRAVERQATDPVEIIGAT